MNFYKLAERIANADVSCFESYLRTGYNGNRTVSLFTSSGNRNLRINLPQSDASKDWFRLEYSSEKRSTNSFMISPIPNRLKKGDGLIVAQFLESLSKCQTIADLILATEGELKNVAAFKSSLEIIRLRLSLLNLENSFSLETEKRKNNIFSATTKIINLCEEYFKIKEGRALSGIPFLAFEANGSALPAAIPTSLNDEDLFKWASSLSEEQREKIVFFDFTRYPELTAEVPFKLKELFPNLSFTCFGMLPESMCDVVLFGNTKFESEEKLREKEFSDNPSECFEEEGKGKEKEVFNEDTGTYYFPNGNKRKASSQAQNQTSPKKLKLSPQDEVLESSEKEKEKEKVDSQEKVEEVLKPIGIRANKKILASASEFFNQLFYGGFKEADQNEIELSEVTPFILSLCIDAFFLRSDLKNASLNSLFDVYKAAFYLDLPSVRKVAEAQIVRILETESLITDLQLDETNEIRENENKEERNLRKSREAEQAIQEIGQHYLNLSSIFLKEESALKKAIPLFIAKKLLSVNTALYKDIFIILLDSKLPLIEIIQSLQENSPAAQDQKEELKLNNLYTGLWQASFDQGGASFKEILALCRKYWNGSRNVEKSLKNHILMAEACLKFDRMAANNRLKKNISLEVKNYLLASLLKSAQAGDNEFKKDGSSKQIIGRTNKRGKVLSDKFLEIVFLMLRSIKGDFEISKINTNKKELISKRLMEFSDKVLHPSELKIRSRLASIASSVDSKNQQARQTSLLLSNPRWGEESTRNLEGRNLSAQPIMAVHLLKLLCPEIGKTTNIVDMLKIASKSLDSLVLSLCSLLQYHLPLQNWNDIIETSFSSLKINPNNELALSLYGASLVELAKVKPMEQEELLKRAKEILEESLKHNPKNSIALTYLARWHLAKNDKTEAIAVFKTIKKATITLNNSELITLMLTGSEKDVKEALKILLRSIDKDGYHSLMELTWFHLMAAYAIRKEDIALLKNLVTFFETCIDENTYTQETLRLLDHIYSNESLIGQVEEEKKEKLRRAIDSKQEVARLNFHKVMTPPREDPSTRYVPQFFHQNYSTAQRADLVSWNQLTVDPSQLFVEPVQINLNLPPALPDPMHLSEEELDFDISQFISWDDEDMFGDAGLNPDK